MWYPESRSPPPLRNRFFNNQRWSRIRTGRSLSNPAALVTTPFHLPAASPHSSALTSASRNQEVIAHAPRQETAQRCGEAESLPAPVVAWPWRCATQRRSHRLQLGVISGRLRLRSAFPSLSGSRRLRGAYQASKCSTKDGTWPKRGRHEIPRFRLLAALPSTLPIPMRRSGLSSHSTYGTYVRTYLHVRRMRTARNTCYVRSAQGFDPSFRHRSGGFFEIRGTQSQRACSFPCEPSGPPGIWLRETSRGFGIGARSASRGLLPSRGPTGP